MKAVVFRGVGKIELEDVDEPRIEEPTDAIVRITTSAICGTDLHMVRGTMPGMKEGTILGHEAVGVVAAIGDDVRNLTVGERVVVPSTIACGVCSYCRAGYHAQCDGANPNGHRAGTAFYGGPAASGPFHGLQAEKARVPLAHVNLVPLPDEVSDEQAILLSDIVPTGFFGADMAHIHPGHTVAIFGCGPVGQFAIAGAKHYGASRVLAVDHRATRLEMARAQGAEIIDFDREDPVAAILRLTGDIGVDRVIDAVGVDAESPRGRGNGNKKRHAQELKEIAPEQNPQGKKWRPGDAPNQALEWAVKCIAKAGTISIIGVYPETDRFFPIGAAMMKNLTLRMGNCHHRKYIPELVRLVRTGALDPSRILTSDAPLTDAIRAYESFDRRESGWVKVALEV
jgi:threonine dehydrogenase-like Zn-dependent dehydrogenase